MGGTIGGIMEDTAPKEVNVLPKLKYGLADLEPFISAEVMDLHYNKHHKAYLDNYIKLSQENDKYLKEGQYDKSASIQPALSFNLGGHVNHSFFWSVLCAPDKVKEPSGALSEHICKHFESLDKFKKVFSDLAVSLPGSGWCWLLFDKWTSSLELQTTANHITMCGSKRYKVLLVVDMWEHAYYLNYKNLRAEYLKNFWNIVDWQYIEQNLWGAK